MNRLLINKKYILFTSLKWTSLFFSFLGLASTFTSLSDFVNPDYSPLRKLLISLSALIVVWLVSLVLCSIYILKKNKHELAEVLGGHHIYVQYGDIFSSNEVNNPAERRNIVIPVNRCFDTLVDNDLVSASTLHGKTMKQLYDSNTYSESSLSTAIQNNLVQQNCSFVQLNLTQKRKGNLKRYNVGSVAEVKVSDECVYFFLGLSAFDQNLTAKVTQEDYAYAIVKLIEFCNSRSQQYPVVMPLIGGGLSRTGRSENAILEYLVSTLKLYKDMINFDIHIIVRDTGKDSIPIASLK